MAANSEIYKPVKSLSIPGHTFEEIQGVPAIPKQSPFRDGHIPAFSCVSIEPDGNSSSDSQSYLKQISRHHGRSYELKIGGEETTVVWDDEYGNIYTKLNAKGNNCTHAEAYTSRVTPSGFLIYGLQESDSMVRALKASELMRSDGIATELFVRVIEPLELPYKHEVIPLVEFKRQLVQKVWEENAADGQRCERTRFQKTTRTQIPRLNIALENMTLFITIRGTQVSEHLFDLNEVSSDEELLRMISNVFFFVNIEEQKKAERDKAYTPDSFSADNKEDIDRYFTEYLPKRTAHNFAKMHQLGLIHRYPHTGNISLVGSIYDLDSVRGEPLGLGDQPITYQEMVNDVKTFLYGHGGFPAAGTIIENLLPEQSCKFTNNFLKYYVQQMGWHGEITRFADIYFLFNKFQNKEQKDLLNYYIDQVVERMDLQYDIIPLEITSFILEKLSALREIDETIDEEKFLNLFQETVQEVIPLDIVMKYQKLYPEIDDVDKKNIEIFGLLYAYKNNVQILPGITALLKENKEEVAEAVSKITSHESIDVYEFHFYRKLIKSWGWEEDILENIDVIHDLFEQFSDPRSDTFYEYYMSILVGQLGSNFDLKAPSEEEMIAMFHEYDQYAAKTRIENALEKVKDDKDRAKVIEEGLKDQLEPNGRLQGFSWDHNSRYNDFVIEYIEQEFRSFYSNEIQALKEKYDEGRAEVIVYWFTKRYLDKFINHLPDEMGKDIENTSKIRIEQLKQEFLST